MVATTRRVRDEEDSGGELGEATTGQGSVGSAASVAAAHDGPAADTAGDAGLRPALKRGAKYQRVGEAAGGCSADDTADSGLETERAEGRALRFAPEPIVHALDAGGTSHRGQTTDWAARRARPGRRTAAERGAAAAARLAAELRATSARQAAAHAAARGLVLAEGLSGTGFPDPARGSHGSFSVADTLPGGGCTGRALRGRCVLAGGRGGCGDAVWAACRGAGF